MKESLLCGCGARWMKFNLVGAIGIGVQLGMLVLLTMVLRMEYMLATVLAVESALLHNFVWHLRFTWAERCSRWPQEIARFFYFNLTTGAVSLGGNLLLMRLLVGRVHLPAVVANLISIAGCSVVNFLINDKCVFRAPLAGRGKYR